MYDDFLKICSYLSKEIEKHCGRPVCVHTIEVNGNSSICSSREVLEEGHYEYSIHEIVYQVIGEDTTRKAAWVQYFNTDGTHSEPEFWFQED